MPTCKQLGPQFFHVGLRHNQINESSTHTREYMHITFKSDSIIYTNVCKLTAWMAGFSSQ
jgi:hypothetical protein